MTRLTEGFLRTPIAHRGLHDLHDGRPENTRAAIRAAIAAGYGIEIDLQLSRDGQAMVFHDYHLERLTHETGLTRDRDAAELGQIGLRHCDETIPVLAEILEIVGGRVPMLVELKDQHGQMGETDGALERAVARDLAGYEGPLAVMSFNPHMMVRMAEIAPDWPRGLVTSPYEKSTHADYPEAYLDHLRAIGDYDRAGAVFISHDVIDLRRPRVSELKVAGAVILCWTVRSPQVEAEARKIAHNITFEGYLAAHPA